MKRMQIWLSYLAPTIILTAASIILFISLVHLDSIFASQTTRYIIQPTSSSDLEIRVQSLEAGQQSLQQDLVFLLNQKLYYFGGIALLISLITGFFGWRTFKDLDGLIQEKIRATLESELYQLDPANLTIRVPAFHPDKEKIIERLQLSGLKNIKTFPELNKSCLQGLTIVPIENAEENQRFLDFVENDKPQAENAAFVLYSTKDPREFRIPLETINRFPRAAASNMPSTVITALLAISRGLHKEKKVKEKEGL